MNNASYAFGKLTEIPGVEAAFPGEIFNEFTLDLNREAAGVVDELVEAGYFAGVPESKIRPGAPGERLIVAVTEKRSRDEIDGLARALKDAVG